MRLVHDLRSSDGRASGVSYWLDSHWGVCCEVLNVAIGAPRNRGTTEESRLCSASLNLV